MVTEGKQPSAKPAEPDPAKTEALPFGANLVIFWHLVVLLSAKHALKVNSLPTNALCTPPSASDDFVWVYVPIKCYTLISIMS